MQEQTLFDLGPKQHKVSFDFGANADICSNKHKGNPASVEANPDAKTKARYRETILNYLRCKGRSYSKEISEATGIGYTTVSGRLSEMKADGTIRETGVMHGKFNLVEIAK